MKVAIAGSRNVQVLNLEADKSFPPPGSKSTSLYCGSIFDSPSKRKIPANLTACGDFWSWQCDSNTRPADYEPDSRVKTKTKQVCSALLQRLNHQVGLVSWVLLHAYFPVWVRAWVNGGKRQNLIYFKFWAAVNKEIRFEKVKGDKRLSIERLIDKS